MTTSHLIPIVTALFLLLAPAADACEPPTTDSETVELFNGKNLDGWYSWLGGPRNRDPDQVFEVVEGCLRVSGTQLGYLATDKSYANYELDAEFRWGRTNHRGRLARDSGLFLHSRGPDGNSFDANGAFQAGIECQIMEGATGDLMLIRGRRADGQDHPLRLTSRIAMARDAEGWPYYDPTGIPLTLKNWGRLNWNDKSRQWRDRIDMRGPNDRELPAGQWNHLRCTCHESSITVRLNGKVVNRATKVWPASGQILLQSEGSEVFFRNLSLRPLASSP